MARPPILRLTPPENFTGLWRTYRENGDVVSQIYYSKGRAIGPLVDSPIYPVSPQPSFPDLGDPVIEYDPAQ
jgi:hypothetical protein